MVQGKSPSSFPRRVARRQSIPKTVWREQGHDDMESAFTTGNTTSDNYVELEEPRELYVFFPQTRQVQTPAGDELEGSLKGYCVPSVDLQPSDRIEHGPATYELEFPNPLPSETNHQYTDLTFKRVRSDGRV